jgi:hypothetical protein
LKSNFIRVCIKWRRGAFRTGVAALGLWLWLVAPDKAQASDDADIVTEMIGCFRPSRPALVMNYDVTYVLQHIRLKRVAGATIKATEGDWRSSVSNAWTPACMIDFHIASPRAGNGAGKDDISLLKRTISVLTMPGLKIIKYAKQNDEFIKPLFRKGRRMKYIEIYNFESGGLDYRRHDLVSGVVETNLAGMADLARQGTEVAGVLQALYAAYLETPVVNNSVVNKVHFNVDGVVRTFDLKMKKGRTSVPVLPRKITALYADIQPAEDGGSRDGSFSMWCMPFREFPVVSDSRLAATSLECSMVPLSGEYGLFLGAIQCTLTNIFVQSPEWN